MKKTITQTLVYILWAVAMAGLPAVGRTQPVASGALNRLDIKLAEAVRVVAAFPNPNAAELLRQAKQLRDQAAQLLANGMPVLALRDIQDAMRLAEEAIKVALEATLLRIRSQLEERMRRAENEVIGSGHLPAEQLLQSAKKMQAEAESYLKGRMYRLAAEKFQQALQQVDRALEAVHGYRFNTGSADLDNERKQFENLAARVQEAVEAGQNSSAKVIYEQAIKQGRSADTSARNGNLAMAQQLYHGATRLLLRALALANANAKNRLESDLEVLADLTGAAEKQLEGKSDSRASILIGRARLLIDEARHALERKNDQEAEWRLALARKFVSRAMRAEPHGAEALGSKLEEELAQLSNDIDDTAQRAREQQNSDASDMAAMARLAAGKAERTMAQGRQRSALQALLTAQRFLANAETMLSKGAARGVDSHEASQNLDHLDASLQEISQSSAVASHDVAMDLVRQAMEIRDKAREAFTRGRFRVANESAGVAMEMLQTALRMTTTAGGSQNK